MGSINPRDSQINTFDRSFSEYLYYVKDCYREALGHTWRYIRITLDGMGRVIGKTEGVDKVAKGVAAVLLYIRVYYRDIDGTLMPLIAAANTRLMTFSDTLAGLVNLPNRVFEFVVNRDDNGNLVLLQKSWLKVSSKAVLVFANIGETLLMLRSFDVEFAGAAAAIGNSRIVQKIISLLNKVPSGAGQKVVAFFAENTLKEIKGKFVIVSAILSTLDAFWSVAENPYWGSNDDLISILLTIGNELGKCYLVIYSVSKIYIYTNCFAAAAISSSICSIAKILIEDYQKTPLTI